MSSVDKAPDKSLVPVEKIRSSPTAGVLAFPIQGPLGDERHRLTVGMTDEDRAFRKQWLQDQILAESEPMPVPGYYEARFNPIRRFVMWPLNTMFKPLNPMLGEQRAINYRWLTGRGFLALWGFLGACYYFKYNANNWESASGWRMYESKPRLLPGDPGYGEKRGLDKSEFANFGFKNSAI